MSIDLVRKLEVKKKNLDQKLEAIPFSRYEQRAKVISELDVVKAALLAAKVLPILGDGKKKHFHYAKKKKDDDSCIVS